MLVISSLWDGMDADFDPMTGVLTITGVATAFEYEDALRSVLFVDSTGYRKSGSISFTFSVSDGLAYSQDQTVTLNVTAVPHITGDIDNVLVYTDGRASEMIGAGLELEYDGIISAAIVTISSGFASDQDVLTFVNQNGISSLYDSNTGTLLLFGDSSVENYEAALESIGYRNTRYNPVAGERVVSFQVVANTAVSNISKALISVEPDAVAPQVSLGTSTSFSEDGAPVAIAPNFTLTPMDESRSEQAWLDGGDCNRHGPRRRFGL